MLVCTQEAARQTGLSVYELVNGYKRGDYPALQIGRGSRRRALRWDVALLRATLEERMRCAEHGDSRAAR